ncbi:heterodisulfide reductase-related iron-sulfur binding cluster [Oryzobacter telluris]|uniref:heterodisulfide reductase-related iron-sulfur binding cluster n=1 Tax=Oryzobacter telluris TaxID=3149179 RepID=UPI00370DD2CD
MGAVQVVAIVLCTVVPLIGWALLFRQVGRFVALYRLGRPDATRTNEPGSRSWVLAKEFLGHTRMSRLKVVAAAHWFTALAFLILFTTLVNAFFQLVQPDYRLPVIGHFAPFEWVVELFAWAGLVGIVVLMAIRQKEHPRSAAGEGGRRSRFFGSTFWQAYYVELTILFVTICIVLLRALEAAMVTRLEPETSLALHFPLTGWMAGLWSGASVPTLATWVYVVATVKILISFAWMITISLQPTMGVAWHRFLAFPNIWFKREASGRTALGAVRPLTVGGKPFTLEALEEMEEGDSLGVGAVEDFTWKGLLDFSTCTECGRCQSQCPAWNTEKPLSPKLLMMTLRDHADAKAPYLKALAEHAGDPEKALASVASKAATPDATRGVEGATTSPAAISWPDVSLVGDTGYDITSPLTAYNPHGPDAVIDADVLWSCTTCGACVEQCPVDIEHVDHIVDMRRYATLIESAFPAELGGLFKNLEGKGNPWGMGARARLDWAKDLPFPVKVLGQDVEKASDVEWLFWVGCAGAYEDRAKKTTRAVAELLDTAGVTFAVLGDGETCTGDSARRAGNELLFQTLAAQNVETFGEFGVTKVVVTCAHCFNTIKNEYPAVGGSYEVVHHTQLLNRLVREKKLTPVARPSDAPGMSTAKNAASTAATVTYHDPCYLGRHNGVYAPPRELIGALPGVELREMERTKEKSFCCGAGGARMWMEEKLGTRINTNRTEEAIATGAERIAIGCPFCRVMISDGLTAKQAAGEAEEVEVVDVAQMLLAAVRRGEDEGESGSVEPETVAVTADTAEADAPTAASAAGATAVAATVVEDEAPVAEPATDDDSDPWDDTPAGAAAPAETAAEPDADADPWDDTPTAAAPAEAPPAAEADTDADPWDDTPASATPSPAEAPPAAEADTDADPWDDTPTAAAPAPAEAPPAAEADTDAGPWDDTPTAAAPAPAASTEDSDPWDEPAAAGPDGSPGEPTDATTTAEPEETAAETEPAAATDEVDPWDEPAGSASPATVEQATVAETAPAATTEDSVDPWDEPAPTTPADSSDEAGPSAADEPEASPSPAEQKQPEESADEPEAEATEEAAPAAAVEDSVDPWDEPADAATPAPVATHEPSPSEDSATSQAAAPEDSAADAVEQAPQDEAPAEDETPGPVADETPAPAEGETPEAADQPEDKPAADKKAAPEFTGDAALLDEPDPWD